MSVSLIDGPEEFSPAYNKIAFTVASTNYSQCEYEYVLDLYVNDAFVFRTRAFPNSSNYGVFNVERVLQDYLSYNFDPTITEFTPQPDCICSYYIEIRDRYNTNADCVGDVTLSSVQFTSDTYFAFNAAFQYASIFDFTQQSHILVNTSSQPLTDVPDRVLIGLNDHAVMGILQEYTVGGMQVNTYGFDDLRIDSFDLTNPYSTISSPIDNSEMRLSVGVGPKNINLTTFDGSPSPPFIDSSVKYYTITFMQTLSPPVDISITKRFDIDYRCSPFKTYRLFWLNRLGDFDSYTFNLKSKRSIDIQRNTYNKFLSNTYQVGDRGKTVTSVVANEAYTIVSNWMTEEEALWLEELFTSPEVRLYSNNVTEETFGITGLQYNAGYLNIQIDGIVTVGSSFTYTATNTSSFGVAGSGSGIITEDVGGGIYKTSIIAPVDPGMSIISVGTMIAQMDNIEHIPVILLNNTYEEKKKNKVKNINYQIEFTPSYSINTQGN